MSNGGRSFLNDCLDFVRRRWGGCCPLCGDEAGAGALCAGCVADLPWLTGNRCERCALPLASGRECGACLRRPPRFDGVAAALAYRYPVNALIHAFKYGRRLGLARALGEALAQAVAADADVIVPMPLAAGRLAERGFNQALEIGRVVAAATGVPLARDACRKVVETPAQAALPWDRRAANVRRAFVCDAALDGLRVAVVDDVLTTGATLNELARVLQRAGAVSVRGWILARTLPS